MLVCDFDVRVFHHFCTIIILLVKLFQLLVNFFTVGFDPLCRLEVFLCLVKVAQHAQCLAVQVQGLSVVLIQLMALLTVADGTTAMSQLKK